MPITKYQLIIIGAGPAGLTAGLYSQRTKLDFIIIGQLIGGTGLEAHIVDNYPGFNSISGPDLMKKFSDQIEKDKIKQEDVKLISKNTDQTFSVFTYQQNEYQAKALILAMGKKVRKLDIKDEQKFLNKGISYCAACDAPLAQNKTAAVVGGGDSALTTALKLSHIAKKVYLIHRRDEFRGAPALVEKVKADKNIEIVYSANVKTASGAKMLEKIILDTKREIATDWLYIEIGGRPALDLCADLNLKTEDDHIWTNKHQNTSLAGVFAAGDITDTPFKQIITAAGQGAIAANSAYSYLKNL